METAIDMHSCHSACQSKEKERENTKLPVVGALLECIIIITDALGQQTRELATPNS